MKKILNYIKYDLVFILLCISNVLNIFMDRESTGLTEQTGGSRIIIQLINVIALGLMSTSIFNRKLPKYFFWVKFLIALLLIYFVLYLYHPKESSYTINHYARMLTNLVGFLFFYLAYANIKPNKLQKYIQIYILTLILASSAKILNSSLFSLENLGAGDTASISLVFLIALIFMFFDSKYATLLYLLAFGFAIISLRRTCIIAFVISIPFVFATVKQNFKLIHLTILFLIATFAGIYLWQYFGSSLVVRFSEMTNGNGDSYGSGRSLFYVILLEDFFKESSNQILGNGLNSVWSFYRSKHYYYLPHAHNDILEILYTFGFLGISVWIIFLSSIIKEKWHKKVNSDKKKLYYMAILMYVIVALASGTILRIEMIPFVMSISFLLAYKNKIKNEDLLLFQRIRHANVLVAKKTIF